MMSFSAKVKKELAFAPVPARHCQIAQIYAIMNNAVNTVEKYGEVFLYINTENMFLAHNFCGLLEEAFHIKPQIRLRLNAKSNKTIYCIGLTDNYDKERVIKAAGSHGGKSNGEFDLLLLKQDCCKRSYLRSAFISNASISDPGKNYHLEFVFYNEQNAGVVLRLLEYFSLKPRLIRRKKNYVAYIKDGEKISEFLGLVGAHQSLLDFESLRVFKTVGNDINRQVNCETANMAKTAKAFVSCQEDILLIERTKGLSSLSKPLREAAELRTEYPNATLKEIGEMMTPILSKSGVNHRLRKISEIADKLRRDLYD